MRLALALCLLIVSSLAGCASSKPLPPQAAPDLSLIRQLEGRWVSEPNEQGKREEVLYRVVSGGTAVEETLFPGEPYEMVSIYVAERDGLKLTHYCSLGNQPEMKAREYKDGRLHFAFSGGNVDTANDHHIHEMVLVLQNARQIEQQWVSHKNGAEEHRKIIKLQKVAPKRG